MEEFLSNKIAFLQLVKEMRSTEVSTKLLVKKEATSAMSRKIIDKIGWLR
jgi:hypothetical protein